MGKFEVLGKFEGQWYSAIGILQSCYVDLPSQPSAVKMSKCTIDNINLGKKFYLVDKGV